MPQLHSMEASPMPKSSHRCRAKTGAAKKCMCTPKLYILYKYTWNTPSIDSNWAQQPLKTPTTEKRCLQAAHIH